jgi:uncharacterized protein with von Willebrand factor type A (vWA) domain
MNHPILRRGLESLPPLLLQHFQDDVAACLQRRHFEHADDWRNSKRNLEETLGRIAEIKEERFEAAERRRRGRRGYGRR